MGTEYEGFCEVGKSSKIKMDSMIGTNNNNNNNKIVLVNSVGTDTGTGRDPTRLQYTLG